MKWLEKRSTALLLSAVMMLSAIWLGSYTSLRRLRIQASASFYESVVGIETDLEKIAAESHNLTVVAQRYLAQDDPLIEQVLAQKERMQQAQDVSQKKSALHALCDSTSQLHAKLETVTMGQRDQEYYQGWKLNIDARLKRIARSPYNEDAREFNSLLEKFPTRFLSIATNIKPLELFE